MLLNTKCLYEVLECSRTDTIDKIKSAYRSKAMANHPDKNPGDAAAEKRFRECTEAYEILSDPNARTRYDQLGAQGFNNTTTTTTDTAQNIFNQMFGGMFGNPFGGNPFGGNPFGGMFNQQFNTRPNNVANTTYNISIPLTINEITTGMNKTVRISIQAPCTTCHGTMTAPGTKSETCTKCDGTGKFTQTGAWITITSCNHCNGSGILITNPCPTCHGTGTINIDKPLTITIPK